jgi:FkbM family methyltransferase
MSILTTVRGKIHGAWILSCFARHLRNWRAVWHAYQRDDPVPYLALRGGLDVHATVRDDVIPIFLEIFGGRCSTAPAFYRPQPRDVVVDVGANIGVFALFCQWRAPGIRVHAFEPDPATSAVLRRNVAHNRLEGRISVYEMAVYDRVGTVRLSDGGTLCSGHRRTVPDGDGPSAPCLPLAQAVELAGAGPVALLKIDTEGAESAIVERAPRSVWAKIERVALEYHDAMAGNRLTEVLRVLGYRCRVYPHRSIPHLGIIHADRVGVPW